MTHSVTSCLYKPILASHVFIDFHHIKIILNFECNVFCIKTERYFKV